MINKQLEYKNIDKKEDPSCDNKTMRASNSLIKKYEKYFLKQEIDHLTNLQYESSNFYGRPKIHKSKIIPNQSKSKVLNIFHVSNQKI